jgi:hypothetical protein
MGPEPIIHNSRSRAVAERHYDFVIVDEVTRLLTVKLSIDVPST